MFTYPVRAAYRPVARAVSTYRHRHQTHGPSLVPLHQPAASPRQTGRPLLIAVSLVKNEGDIVPAWLSHVTAIFDLVYIADHLSIDGTREFLMESARSQGRIRVFSLDHRGYFQEEATNQLAAIAARENPDSWILPMDADEFLCLTEQPLSLSDVGRDRLLRVTWRNCVPARLASDDEFTFTSPCLISPDLSGWKKLGLHSSSLLQKNWRLTQGNHTVLDGLGREIGQDAQICLGELLHVPIRSVDHFALKCLQGVLAYRSLPADRTQLGQGSHWTHMIRTVLETRALGPDTVRGFVASYGYPERQTGTGTSIPEMALAGWTSGPLGVPRGEVTGRMVRLHRFLELADLILEEGGSRDADLADFLAIAAAGVGEDRP